MKNLTLQLSDLVRCIVAPNPGPFTKNGTNTYIIGKNELAIVDPGPDHDAHLEALLSQTKGQKVTHIFVTHTHKDHSPLANRLAEQTGARIVGCAKHFLSKPHLSAADNPFDGATDHSYAPEQILEDGEEIHTREWTLAAVATPGHTLNHLSFALKEEQTLFTGDHIMGWSTSVIAPPEGHMGAYIRSLEKLVEGTNTRFLSGHGDPIENGIERAAQLLHHRHNRHQNLLKTLEGNPATLDALLNTLYGDIDPKLKRAAHLTLQAHLEWAHENHQVHLDGDIYYI